MDCIPPGSSVRGILQARILEWVAIVSSRGSSLPRDQTLVSSVSCIAWGSLLLNPGEALGWLWCPLKQTFILSLGGEHSTHCDQKADACVSETLSSRLLAWLGSQELWMCDPLKEWMSEGMEESVNGPMRKDCREYKPRDFLSQVSAN